MADSQWDTYNPILQEILRRQGLDQSAGAPSPDLRGQAGPVISGNMGGPGSFQNVPNAQAPIAQGNSGPQLSNPNPGQGNPGQGAPNFQDYLHSLGLNGGDFGVNMPAAPDLTAGVNDQYGGVLDFLKRSIDRTQNQGDKASNNLGDIYSAMAQMNKKSGKVIKKQGRRSTKQIKGLYDKLGTNRDQQIQKQTGAVERRLQDLGISAALPASTERMMKESGQDHRLIARQEGRAVSNSQNNASNWANFAKAGAQGARLAGAEQQAQLSQSVADAVFQLQGQIATTKADKAAAMMAAQQAEYGMAADAATQQQAAAMQKAGFAQQFQQMMMDQANAGGTATPQTGQDLVAQILMNQAKQEPGVNRKDAASMSEAMPGIIAGMTPRTDNYNAQQPISEQDFYSQLRQQALDAGYSPEMVDALLQKQVYDQFYGG